MTGAHRADREARFAGPRTRRQRNRVPVPLRADAGGTAADIADDLGTSARTAANVRKRLAADGLDTARTERPRSGGPAALDGKAEAVLVGLACSPVPDEPTARMLATELVELAVVTSVSEDTVLRVVRRATPSRGRRRVGASRRGRR